MFCPSCGAPNLAQAQTCVSCGKALPRLEAAATNTSATPPQPQVPVGGEGSWPTVGANPDASRNNYGYSGYGGYNTNPVQAGVAGYYSEPPSYTLPADRSGVSSYNNAPPPYMNYSVPVDRVGVSTAPNNFWPRVGAYFIDQIICSVIFGLVFGIPMIAWAVSFFTKYANDLNACSSSSGSYDYTACNAAIRSIFIDKGELGPLLSVAISTFVVGLLLVLAYQVLLTARGQTLGKRVFGLKVVRADGSPPGFGVALLRQTVGYLVSSFFFGLGFLWVAFESNNRGWHDSIAGTYVVYV